MALELSDRGITQFEGIVDLYHSFNSSEISITTANMVWSIDGIIGKNRMQTEQEDEQVDRFHIDGY